ncbi:MAG: cyclic nucleotide-binding domain-containing protein, partial [Armatimonadetes bacterium]|nr:cyclic nucleotide-binding domain-containing protein [Armatimonadota bacterium]
RHWEEGAVLTAWQAPARWLHVLLDGTAAVSAPDPSGGRRDLGMLEPGDTVGLEALAPDGVYALTNRALTPCLTLSLPATALAELELAEEKARRLRETEDRVRSVRHLSVFRNLAEAQVAAFMGKARPERFAPTDVIIRQGGAGDRFHVLQDGEVAVMQERDGERHSLAELGPGACFGELALLFNVPRTADVVALTAVETLSLGRDDFVRIFATGPPGGHMLFHLSLSRVLKLGATGQGGAD